jgi:hypothetical protein
MGLMMEESRQKLTPLKNSFTQNDVESELNSLFLSIFNDHISGAASDANVLGAMQLGSPDLLKKAIHADGLVLVKEEQMFSASRYLYQAWKAKNQSGRGLHFLRTYLQLLFYGESRVDQMWQKSDKPYPESLQRNTVNIDTDKYYLTSRIEISLDITLAGIATPALLNAIGSTIPARFVPMFRFAISAIINVESSASIRAFRQQLIVARVIGIRDQVRWKLGKDGRPAWGLGENENHPIIEIDF